MTLSLWDANAGNTVGHLSNVKTVTSSLRTKWGATSSCTNNQIGDFIRGGGIGYSKEFMNTNFWADEGAVIGIIAEQIVEHGGYFCPYQMQCGNLNRHTYSWFEYYFPEGIDGSNCVWLCEKGFSGANCAPQKATLNEDVSPLSMSFPREIALKKNEADGIYNSSLAGNINVFSQTKNCTVGNNKTNGKDCGEINIVLGVTKVMENGAMVAPVHVGCQWKDWSGVNSSVHSVRRCGANEKILCRPGYTPNATETDCVLASQDMITVRDLTFCKGFDPNKYNSKDHVLDQSGDCVRYFCRDNNMTFAAVDDTTCVACAKGALGGPNKEDGTCVKCEMGQYFDQDTNSCKTAVAFSKIDMMYGRGMTKNDHKVLDTQCWTLTKPDDYRTCVFSGADNSLRTSFRVPSVTGGGMVTEFKWGSPKDQLLIDSWNNAGFVPINPSVGGGVLGTGSGGTGTGTKPSSGGGGGAGAMHHNELVDPYANMTNGGTNGGKMGYVGGVNTESWDAGGSSGSPENFMMQRL
ncbi:MAG: hypothetical protein IJD52_03375 [Alphaproteobacteria bacterium]|nr:hypothetical protein [Alphaproteobacteria bacterium]